MGTGLRHWEDQPDKKAWAMNRAVGRRVSCAAMRQPISLWAELERVGSGRGLQWNSTSGEATINGKFFEPPASVLFEGGQFIEPPDADPFVRWCRRGEQVTAPPIPIRQHPASLPE
jgi:hypothetical protein